MSKCYAGHTHRHKYNKLSGVQSREESPPGDLFVCQQMIWQPCNTKCGNPVDRTVSKLLPFDFPCPKTQIRTPKSCFYHVYYESYGEIRKFGNPVIRNLATLLSGGFEIAPIRFPMPENILVDTKIMFLSQLSDKLWRKTEKMIIFGGFFEIFFSKIFFFKN